MTNNVKNITQHNYTLFFNSFMIDDNFILLKSLLWVMLSIVNKPQSKLISRLGDKQFLLRKIKYSQSSQLQYSTHYCCKYETVIDI